MKNKKKKIGSTFYLARRPICFCEQKYTQDCG